MMVGDEALDPRLAFYLEHKDQIGEWLKLPELERAAADRFFESLGDPLEERGSELDGSPVLSQNIAGRWKSLLFHRPAWPTPDAQWPLIGIGLEWKTGSTGFEQGYMGIRVEMSIDGMEPLRTGVIEALGSVAEAAGFKKSNYWPAYNYIRPSQPRYWEELDTFAMEIIEAVANLWSPTWEVADRASLEWRAESS